MSAALRHSPLKLRPSTSWVPTDRDRVIFQWVKFEGQTQSWVAEQLGINQSTVSRIVERYERWIARGGPGATGGLCHDEQVRYQLWLTSERNERIIASCLRIANDMEHQIDVSRTTITRNNLSPSQENEVKTYHETVDRSAKAARFLRLAWRINMDQLKLKEREPLPPLDPLTEDEADERMDVAAPQSRDQWSRSDDNPAEASRSEDPPSERATPRVFPRQTCEQTEPSELHNAKGTPVVSGAPMSVVSGPVVSGSPDPDTPSDRQVSASETTHNMHNDANQETTPTPVPTTTSYRESHPQEIKTPAYRDWLPPPEMSPSNSVPGIPDHTALAASP